MFLYIWLKLKCLTSQKWRMTFLWDDYKCESMLRASDALARIRRLTHRQNTSPYKKNLVPCLCARRFLPLDPTQSYPLPCCRFTNTTLSSPLLLLLPSMPAPEPIKLAVDVAYSTEAKGLASRLAPVLKMRNRQRACQRIQRTADGAMMVGPMQHLLLS
jgi:hypothetical protein